MDTVLNIITALGTVVAGVSIFAGYIKYRISKRDEYLNQVRSSLQVLSTNMMEINRILNYELANEMTMQIVYTKEASPYISQVFRICQDIYVNKPQEEKAKKELSDVFRYFSTSFQTPLVIKYAQTLKEINEAAVLFYPLFQGLYRFSFACTQMLANILQRYKSMLLSEELISSILYDQIIEKKYNDIEDLKKDMIENLVSVLETDRNRQGQKALDCLLKLVDIVYTSHINQKPQNLYSVGKQTSKIKLNTKIETITGDLREAEKCFRDLLTHDETVDYASFVQTIEDSIS